MRMGQRVCVLLIAGVLAALSGRSLALGLGDPVVHSRIGEPLQVSIPLHCQQDECEQVEVALLGPNEYRAAGIDYPALGSSVTLVYDAAADALTVRTTTPVSKPVVHLLIQMRAGSLSMQTDVAARLLTAGGGPTETTQVAPAPPSGGMLAPQAASVPAEAVPPADGAGQMAAAPANSATERSPAPNMRAPVKPERGTAPLVKSDSQDDWSVIKQYLTQLDPGTVATGAGIGIGLLLAWVVLRAIRKLLQGLWRTISGAVGQWRYRRAASKRDATALRAEPSIGAPQARRIAPQVSATRPKVALSGPAQAAAGRTRDKPASQRIAVDSDTVVQTLRRQSAAEPERIDLRLKLLERLFEIQDREAFADEAHAVQPALSQKGWERVRLMGKQLSPYDELFLDLNKEADLVAPVPLIRANY